MSIKCPQCGAEYDVTLFPFGRTIRCDCGASVDLAVGHQKVRASGSSETTGYPHGNETGIPAKPPWSRGTSDRRLLWLVAPNVLMGLSAACVAAFFYQRVERPPAHWIAAFVGIVMSQASLLAIWGTLGTNYLWQRLSGVLISIIYLTPLLTIGLGLPYGDSFFHVLLTTAVGTILLLIARHFRVAIKSDDLPLASIVPLQYSLHHLLIWTVILACSLVTGRWMRSHLPHQESFLDILLFAAPFGAIGVLPVWGILATKRPLLYVVGVVAAAGGFSWCVSLILGVPTKVRPLWITIGATQAVVLVISLLAVRTLGYRLVRLPSPRRVAATP